MTVTIKMQSRGVLTLPKKIRTRMRVDVGDMMTLQERDGGIFIAPVSRMDKELRDDVRAALRDLQTGNYIEFSSIKEFHEKRKKKWGRK